MNSDSRFTVGTWIPNMASDPVNRVYGVIPKTFPLSIHACRDVLSGFGESRILHMIEMCGGSVEKYEMSRDCVSCSEGEFCVGREILRIEVGGGFYTDYCIVPDGSEAPHCHLKRAAGCPGDIFYAEKGKVLADALMHLCQNRIAARILTRDDRMSRLLRTYYVGEGSRISDLFYIPGSFYRDFGFSKHAFDAFLRLMYALACLRGDASCADRSKRVLIPQMNKTPQFIGMQDSSVFRGYFSELDLDTGIDAGWLRPRETEFMRNVRAGYIVPLKDRGVALRFRKIGDFSFNGAYFPFTRDIVLSPTGSEHFSHEYGHALYGTYSLSRDRGFDPCYERYSKLLREDPVVRGYANLDYFLKRTEAFARMYNRFVFLKFGDGLLNTHAEDHVHPKDMILDGLVDRYFTDLFGRIF